MKYILELLKKQPKKVKINPLFFDIVNIYNSSNELKKIKISNHCCNLLNKAKILPQNLDSFYKKFKLPKNSFFPLFLKLRKEYLEKLNIKKKEKNLYIYNKMKILPQSVKFLMRLLSIIEKELNKFKKIPLWNKIIYPKSKAKVNQYLKYNNIEWSLLFNNFIAELVKKYGYKVDSEIIRKIDLFILEIEDQEYSNEAILKKFRHLCKKYHPDHGGDARYFNILKNTKDKLLKKNGFNL